MRLTLKSKVLLLAMVPVLLFALVLSGMRNAIEQFQVAQPVVRLDFVLVVQQLRWTWLFAPSRDPYQQVLVAVAVRIRKRMVLANTHLDVAVLAEHAFVTPAVVCIAAGTLDVRSWIVAAPDARTLGH